MPRKREALSFVEQMRRLHEAGLDKVAKQNTEQTTDSNTLPTLEERLRKLLGIVNDNKRPSNHMLFFVMYDIESNKVRRQIVKYLQSKGCTRVQKSIFLADLPTADFEQIKSDLAEVQACYDNEDSILVVPISTDYLKAMKVIGQQINVDIITHAKNTIFF